MRRLLSTLPTVAILIAVLGYGLSEKLHARLLQFAEATWPGYHRLRVDPRPPDCDPKAAMADDGDDLDALLDATETVPVRSADDELTDDLLGHDGVAPSAVAIAAARRHCEGLKLVYGRTVAAITPTVRWFRAGETQLAKWGAFGVEHLSHALVALLLLAAATATWTGGHIALRGPVTIAEGRVRAGAELMASQLLLTSSMVAWQAQVAAGTHETSSLHSFWAAGFAVLSLLAAVRLARPGSTLADGGSVRRGLLTVPLYAFMTMLCAAYFFVVEGHAGGLAIYLDKLSEHALLYIHVGLYVWAGMLLKQSRISNLVLNMVRPWRLSPELFSLVVVVMAALPTAYSGASGIFVIAAGALIYEKLRAAGSRRGLALATTAMSGSMGVVLSPCLLVVIVASLNKDVTTDELFAWGRWVFLLTVGLFAIVLWVTRQSPFTMASPRDAVTASWSEAKPLLPYVGIFTMMMLVLAFVLDTRLDEHSAPILLPFMMLVLLAYDRWSGRKLWSRRHHRERPGVATATVEATEETSSHIGALLLLMGLSVCVGGVIERSEVMSMVPSDFGSAALAMFCLVGVLVLVGMTMDPYGAVILVSATLVPIAQGNGIHPVHFWMVVLVAFELGYLTPPVALNHLLTRQVVGLKEAAVGANAPTGTVWLRYERLLLPVTVMGTALVLVAFGPLIVDAVSEHRTISVGGGVFDGSR